ncbi:MAG TPA: hypothetical protein VGM26_01605 [Rhizomicrobium sp.]|jgi:hypothetical protein
MLYRGYDLEQKQMMVGWQVTITKDDAFVRHSGVSKDLETVMVETRDYIDQLLLQISSPSTE